MKLMSLNMWGGMLSERFPDFFEKYQNVDIFCFQEVYKDAEKDKEGDFLSLWDTSKDSLNLFEDLEKMLPEHKGFFCPCVEGFYGIAIFIKKDFEILEEGSEWVFGKGEWKQDCTHSRKLQYLKVKKDSKNFLITNLHGVWIAKTNKEDLPCRIKQSEITRKFFDKHKGPKVLVGDLNLRHDSESIKILEEGYRNLITDFEINSTRTSFYKKEYKLADYMIVSKDIEVEDFKVLSEEVSDHSALLLEFKT